MERRAAREATRFRIDDGRGFRLRDFDPADTGGFRSKHAAAAALEQGTALLSDLQDKLYAQDRWAVLVILQAMDAAGKDSTVKHVMRGVNPMGCQVHSFKAPSAEELDHDYLWRCAKALPERGRIGIFNRSYYEEVLVVRVHRDILHKQRIPEALLTPALWRQRYADIAGFERYLTNNGVVIRKFFLYVSREEQRRRFLDRLEQPDKNWKFSLADAREREHWDAYMAAYEDLIRHTSTPESPWYVVPADHKWFTRVVVAEAIVEALSGLKLTYPTVDGSKRAELDAARVALLEQAPGGAQRGSGKRATAKTSATQRARAAKPRRAKAKPVKPRATRAKTRKRAR